MDAAMLVKAMNSPEMLQSVLEHFPSDLIEAELTLLPQAQQQRFNELRASLAQKPLKEGDIVQYTNPDNLQRSRVFEGLDLSIEYIWRGGGDGSGDLALCRLPDGREETFGLVTLRSL